MDQSEGHVICHLDSLDDPTILKILHCLSVVELLRLEIVCKRLAGIVPWALKRVTELHWSHRKSVSHTLVEFPRGTVWLASGTARFVSLIKLFGATITQLNIDEYAELRSTPVLETDALNHNLLAALTKYAVTLRSLTLTCCSPEVCISTVPGSEHPNGSLCDIWDQFQTFLYSMPLLESFNWYMKDAGNANRFLSFLSPSLRSVSLRGWELNQRDLMAFLRSHPDLIKLELHIVLKLDAELGAMPALLQCIPPDIQELCLASRIGGLSAEEGGPDWNDMSSLGRLFALRSLYLPDAKLFKNALKGVFERCQNLEFLQISDPGGVGDEGGLEPLGSLKKLRILSISEIGPPTGEQVVTATRGLSGLEKLILDGILAGFCFHGDWIALAENCPNLQCLVDQKSRSLGVCWFLHTLLRARVGSNIPFILSTGLGQAQFTPEEWITVFPNIDEMSPDQLRGQMRQFLRKHNCPSWI